MILFGGALLIGAVIAAFARRLSLGAVAALMLVAMVPFLTVVDVYHLYRFRDDGDKPVICIGRDWTARRCSETKALPPLIARTYR